MKIEYQIHDLNDVVCAYTAQKNVNGVLTDVGGRRGMTIELQIMKVVLSAPTSAISNKQKAEMILVGGHQHRLQCHKAQNAKNRLIATLEKSLLWIKFKGSSFEDLYKDVDTVLKNNKCTYAGQITKYDIAKRIGAFVGHKPQKFVYLHSGALIGARRLFGNPNLKEGVYPLGMFRKYFQSLDAMEIEDILCVFHNIYDNGGIVIRYFFDDNTTPNCHMFWPKQPTKTAVNKVLIKNNLPTIK